MESHDKIVKKTYARIGFLGNPSDGYHGRTISFSITNFWAEVTLTPSIGIHFTPHPLHDSTSCASLAALKHRAETCGYYGGVRLLMAAVKAFYDHCLQAGLALPGGHGMPAAAEGGSASGGHAHAHAGPGRPPACGFTLSYETNIPRQTGLAGSSAIICSALKCLLQYYGLTGPVHVPLHVRPGLALAAESELGITAGLQDRVAQFYGGLVYMDFTEQPQQQAKEQEQGAPGQAAGSGPGSVAPAGASVSVSASGGCGGVYERLEPGLLPHHLYLMYSENPSDSGKVHATVKQRWLAGDEAVRTDMARVAQCAEEGRRLLVSGGGGGMGAGGGVAELARLMDLNFDLRRRMFGDAALGARNLRMIELARSMGAAAKFSGSGGAALVLCPDGDTQAQQLAEAASAEDFIMVKVHVAPPYEEE